MGSEIWTCDLNPEKSDSPYKTTQLAYSTMAPCIYHPHWKNGLLPIALR